MLSIVINQMLVMAAFMVLGAVLYKTKLVSKEGSKSFTTLCLYIIAPMTVVRSLCIAYSKEKAHALFLSFLLGILVQAIGLLVSKIIYRNQPMEEFATDYPNTAFFGLPVIQAILGPEAVFYIVPLGGFIAILQHTYGSYLLSGDKKDFNLKKILLSPGFVGMACGFLIFFSGIGDKLPKVLTSCINTIADMSPFAMAVLGMFLIQSDFSRLYKSTKIYIVSIIRVLVIPLICAFVLRFIPADYTMKLTILIAFAGPIGVSLASYAMLKNNDYATASLYVSVSTVICLFTLPVFTVLAEKILA